MHGRYAKELNNVVIGMNRIRFEISLLVQKCTSHAGLQASQLGYQT